MRAILLSVALMALAASATRVPAQQPLTLAEADQRGQMIFEQTGSTSMVLVVVRNHEGMMKGYGETYPGSGVRPDENSVLRLCSISKTFTGAVLAQMVEEGKVKLDDPLQRYAPARQVVPKGVDGSPITLLELATHTSGLPREVSAYPRKTPHFVFPDRKFRWVWLPRQRLKSRPGTAAVYSNIGFDLLGDALATAEKKPYAQVVYERILHPLGLWDTTLVPSRDQCARLLEGSRDEGPCTDTQPSGASGGLYSTATDMTKVLQSLLRIQGPNLVGSAMTIRRKPEELKSVEGLSHAGDPTGIGLAWIQLGDPDSPSMVMQKTGGGAGFTTYIALNLARQTGVFLAITDGKGKQQIDFFHEANNLLADLAGVPQLPAKTHPARAAKKTLRRPRTRVKAAR